MALKTSVSDAAANTVISPVAGGPAGWRATAAEGDAAVAGAALGLAAAEAAATDGEAAAAADAATAGDATAGEAAPTAGGVRTGFAAVAGAAAGAVVGADGLPDVQAAEIKTAPSAAIKPRRGTGMQTSREEFSCPNV
jgi:hypothetical protein